MFELNGDGDALQNVPTLAHFAEVAEFTHRVGNWMDEYMLPRRAG